MLQKEYKGLSVKLLQASRSKVTGKQLWSFEIEIPTCIIKEINTHGMLSRCTQSSRAVPIKDKIAQIRQKPFIPIRWGKKQIGMQAYKECNNQIEYLDHGTDCYFTMDRDEDYLSRIDSNLEHAKAWDDAGYHKQIVNRFIENDSYTRMVLSATEWSNFFNLRIHHAAEPHIMYIARMIYEVMREGEKQHLVRMLSPGEWHVPYINREMVNGKMIYFHPETNKPLSEKEAINLSLSCIAQTSYRKHDTSDEKTERIVSRLFPDGEPAHASPAQHIGTPMENPICIFDPDRARQGWENGVSHQDRYSNLWSGQFKHWIQYRKLIPGENCMNFDDFLFDRRIKEIDKLFE